MKKSAYFAIAALVLIVAVVAAPDAPPPANLPAQRSVSAQELADAYSGNEMAAERDFEKTPIRVEGEVYSVSDGGAVMLLAGPGSVMSLSMVNESDPTLLDLKRGQRFAAVCQQTLNILGTVTPMYCRPDLSAPTVQTSPRP